MSRRGEKWKPEYIDSLLHWAEDFQIWSDVKDGKGRFLPNPPPFMRLWVEQVPKTSNRVVHYWREHNPEFKEAWEEARLRVERIINEGVMIGAYNPQYTQFYMKNNYGYQDKVEKTVEVNVKKIEDVLKEMDKDGDKY